MELERHREFKSALAARGWARADARGWKWVKGSRSLVFDTSSWLMLFVRGQRSHDVAVPSERRLDAWTLNLIDYLLDLEERVGRLET
jgi:hypothetical protein